MATGISTTSISGLGLSGLSSGLDTSGIITKLMAIESAPQSQLKTQLTTLQTHTTALQSLNTAVAAVATTAKAALGANALTSFIATSSSSAATVSASSAASAGSLSFTVDRLAAAQVTVTDAMTAWDTTATPSITVRTGAAGGTQTDTTLTFTSSNLDDVVAAINGGKLGVTATKVAAGTDANGVAQFRLQLRSAPGASNAFAVSTGTAFASGSTIGTTVSTAADAQLTLYGGTSAEQKVTSSSNTFANLLTGVTVTAAAVSTAPVTISLATDVTAASTSAKALTSGLVALFSGIASSTAVTTKSGTSGSGSTATSGGIFTGDSLVRAAKDSMLAAVSGAVGGRSPSTIGITLTKDGTITFDQAVFETAMKADPAGTTAMYQAIATSVSKAATAFSDPYTGSVTKQITSEQSQQSSMTSRIGDWDTRLAAIQAQYTKQFNALETALNSLSSQSSYLTSQIAGLTTNYQSTS